MGIATPAEPYDYGKEGQYIRVFLMDDTRNRNGWKVSWEVIKQYARQFVGFPGIEYVGCEGGECHLDHVDGPTYEQSLAVQSKYKVTETVDVVFEEASRTAYAIMRVTDEAFGGRLASGERLFVSPSVWPDDAHTYGRTPRGHPFTDVYAFRPLHLAFVDEPAYGANAAVESACEGPEGECVPQLSASVCPDRLRGRLEGLAAAIAVKRAFKRRLNNL